MPWDRRGDFARIWRERRDETGHEHEVKWQKVNRDSREFCARSVDHFFKTGWLWFHCLVVEKARVDLRQHDRDWDLARRKHFTMLVANKIKRALRHGGQDQIFNVWVDPIASRYKKADEAVEVVAGNIVAEMGTRKPEIKVRTHDSKETPAIQLCDLLLGAVMDAWNKKATRTEKAEIAARIATHLRWVDLAADTLPGEKKFNIWLFHDPTSDQPRPVATRRVGGR